MRNKPTTFGELAIGEVFWWRDTAAIQHGPRAPEPMLKAAGDCYAWSRGWGRAEPHYPVERIHGAKNGRHS